MKRIALLMIVVSFPLFFTACASMQNEWKKSSEMYDRINGKGKVSVPAQVNQNFVPKVYQLTLVDLDLPQKENKNVQEVKEVKSHKLIKEEAIEKIKEEKIKDRRIDILEERVEKIESKQEKLMGRIAESEDNINLNSERKYAVISGFAMSSAVLNNVMKEKIKTLVEWIKEGIKVESTIEGLTDSFGPKEVNEKLKIKRAEVVRDFIVNELGPENNVPFDKGSKWRDYFTIKSGENIDRYGQPEKNRIVRFIIVLDK